jgi:hypothetical protein
MNMVLIENTAGSSQVITIIEEFAGHSVSRDLNPGEHTRIPVGPVQVDRGARDLSRRLVDPGSRAQRHDPGLDRHLGRLIQFSGLSRREK